MNRHLSEGLLMANGDDGTYLLRPSKKPGQLSLSVRLEIFFVPLWPSTMPNNHALTMPNNHALTMVKTREPMVKFYSLVDVPILSNISKLVGTDTNTHLAWESSIA